MWGYRPHNWAMKVRVLGCTGQKLDFGPKCIGNYIYKEFIGGAFAEQRD